MPSQINDKQHYLNSIFNAPDLENIKNDEEHYKIINQAIDTYNYIVNKLSPNSSLSAEIDKYITNFSNYFKDKRMAKKKLEELQKNLKLFNQQIENEKIEQKILSQNYNKNLKKYENAIEYRKYLILLYLIKACRIKVLTANIYNVQKILNMLSIGHLNLILTTLKNITTQTEASKCFDSEPFFQKALNISGMSIFELPKETLKVDISKTLDKKKKTILDTNKNKKISLISKIEDLVNEFKMSGIEEKDVRKCFSEYTDNNGFEKINGTLRNTITVANLNIDTLKKYVSPMEWPSLSQTIRTMQNEFLKKPIEEKTTVFRGMDYIGLKAMFNNGAQTSLPEYEHLTQQYLDNIISSHPIIYDKGFLSTTFTEEKMYKGNVVLTITVPKGSFAIDISGWSSHSQAEDEILLKNSTKLKVQSGKITGIGNNKKVWLNTIVV